ncbi:MAG: hypothetical protein IPL10_06180 [Bacteroidetes bacterium]|nr:hypothetical protein [Bacteroidota bacterium]
MESYSKDILRMKVINRILKYSKEHSLMSLEKLTTDELFTIQSSAFKDMLHNSGIKVRTSLKQTY